jgi:hypothetical protein
MTDLNSDPELRETDEETIDEIKTNFDNLELEEDFMRSRYI